MESTLTKFFWDEHYFKKLRTEVHAVKVLTETVLSEIDKKGKGNKSFTNELNHNIDLFHASTTGANIRVHEELYNRITSFLQTLTLFIRTSSDTKHQLPIHGLISPPKVFSLPTLCRILWTHVEEVCKESNNHSVIRTKHSTAASVEVTMASKSSQTDNSCLRFCESCQLSTGLIKMLVNLIIEEQKKYCVNKTHVSEFRGQIVNKVVEMSQWGAMNGWVNAIHEDIKWVIEIVATFQTQNLNLLRTLEKMKEEHKCVQTKLKTDLLLVKTQLAAEKAQNSYLRHQIEDINMSLNRRIEYEQNLQDRISKHSQSLKVLQKSTKNLAKDIAVTKNMYKLLSTFVKTTLSAELRTINHITEITTKALQQLIDTSCEVFNKESVLKAELQGKRDFIDSLQKKCAVFEQEKLMENKYFEKLEAMEKEKMQKENNIKILQQKVEVLEMTLEESKAQELLYKSKVESSTVPKIKLLGDPVQDMENQRQLNKWQMKRLLNENRDLKMTIQKLKSVRTKPTNTLQ